LLAARLERDSIQDKIDLAENVKVPNDIKDWWIKDLERQIEETKDYFMKWLVQVQETPEVRKEKEIIIE